MRSIKLVFFTGSPLGSTKDLRACEVESNFDRRIFVGIGTMHRVFPNAFGKKRADGAGLCLGGIGCSDQFPEILYSVVFFKRCGDNWAGGHKRNQFAVEGAFAVNRIELTRFLFRKLGVLHGDDPETSFVDFCQDCADMPSANGIGLDHSKRYISSHLLGICG